MPEAFKCGYVALIGFPNVGKSTLLNRLVGGKLAITSPKPQTTRFRLLGIVNLPEAQILFLDTPGILEPQGPLNQTLVQAALTALNEADAVVWLGGAPPPDPQDRGRLAPLQKPSRPPL